MLSQEYVKSLLQTLLSQSSQSDVNNIDRNSSKKSNTNCPLTPAEALVIIGLIGGVLSVGSVLIDKDQTVSIVLQGSLKRQTEMDKMLEKMGSMPFEDVLAALFDRFG